MTSRTGESPLCDNCPGGCARWGMCLYSDAMPNPSPAGLPAARAAEWVAPAQPASPDAVQARPGYIDTPKDTTGPSSPEIGLSGAHP